MRRAHIVWLIALVLIAVAAAGAWRNSLFAQPIWSAAGLTRLAAFSLGYWLLVFIAGRRAVAIICAGAILWTAFSVGPLPLAAAALILLSAYGLGTLLASGAIAIACGLAVYALTIGWLAALPINHPLLYAGILIPGIVQAWRRRKGRTSVSDSVAALPLYLATMHLLAALFPESGSDALAMHLTVPAWIANHGRWDFDPSHFSWSLMPMNGDWIFTLAYTLGGEQAARLLNVAMVLLTAALVHSLARRVAGDRAATLAASLWLSTPVLYFVSGSLLVESFWTLMVCATFAALADAPSTRPVVTAGLLAGAALSAKLLATAFLAPLAIFGAIVTRRRPALAAAAVFVALGLGAKPYAEAWLKTGNPVFPFFNSVFRSPLFPTDIPNADPRYPPAFDWKVLWTATFRSARMQDGHNGSLGFHYLLLLPPTLVLLYRAPWLARAALLGAIAGAAMVFSQMGYLRYILPALALACAAFAWTIDAMLRKRLAPVIVAVILVNTYFLSASGYYTRDFALPPTSSARSEYLREAAPARALADYWNREARGEPVAFFDDDQVAGLVGRPYSASWRTWSFRRALDQATSPGEVLEILRARGIRRAIAPAPEAWFASHHAAAQGLLHACGEVASRNGTAAAWRIRDNCQAAAYFESAPVAAQGVYDDISGAVRYSGGWLHDRQFAAAAGHTLTYTRTPGDYFQIKFQGRRVRVTYTAAHNRGVADVTVDGAPAGRLDQYAPATRWQSEAAFDAGSSGSHVLRVTLTAARSGGYLDLDRFVVE